MRSPLLFSFVAAVLVASLLQTPAAAEEELSLVVYAIDCATVAPGTLTTAEHIMTRAFGSASIRAKWRDLQTPPLPNDDANQVTVVILSREMAEQKARRDGISPSALATAAPLARRAWVFLSKIEEAAHTQHVSLGTALGTVIAHEVAHVAANMPHTSRGIMGRELHLATDAFEGFSAEQGRMLKTAMRPSADRARQGASLAFNQHLRDE